MRSRQGNGVRKRRSWFAAGLAVVLCGAVATPAAAICPLCDATVRLDETLATCLAGRLDAMLQRLSAERLPVVGVDLSDCPKLPPGRTALPTDARAMVPVGPGGTPGPEELDRMFLADADSLKCLVDAIVRRTASLDPGVAFDLARLCP